MRDLKIFLFTLFFGIIYSQPSNQIKTYDNLVGMPSNYVYHTAIDKEGYLWFATDNGVVKYNGNYIKIFQIKNNLPSNDIFGIKVDYRNKKWLKGYFKGLYYIENDVVKIVPNSKELKAVHFLFEKQNVFYFTTSDAKIYYYDEKKKELVFFRNSIINNTYSLHDYDENLQLFILKSKDDNYCFYDLKKNVFYELLQDLIPFPFHFNKNVVFTTKSARKELLIEKGSNNSWCFLRDGKNIVRKKMFTQSGPNETLKVVEISNQSFSLLSDTNNFYVYEGLKYNKEKSDLINRAGININEVYGLYLDLENNIWVITTNHELKKYSNNNFSIAFDAFTNIVNEINFNKIKSINQQNNILYFITNNNNLYSYNLDTKQVKLIEKIDLQLSVYEILIHNKTLIIDYAQGYSIYTINETGDLNFKSFSNIINRGLSCYNDAVFHIRDAGLYKNQKLLFKQKNDIRFNRLKIYNNCAYFSNEEIVYCYQLDTKKIISNKNIIYTNFIVEHNNKILIGTNSNILYLTDLNLEILDKINFGEEAITKVMANKNNFFVATNKYLNLFVLKDNKLKLISKFSLLSLGIKSKILSIISNKNKIHFITNEGVFSLLNFKPSKSSKSEIGFDYVTINDSVYYNFEKLHLNRDQNNLTIKTSMFSFDNNLNVIEKKYSLSKSNNPESWKDFKEESITFKDLAPGNYTFTVKATFLVSELKNETSYKKIQFSIEPYLWETLGFKILLFLILIAVVFYIFHRYKAKSKKEFSDKLKLLNLEMKSLRMQMNPHFIFNVINNLQSNIILADEIKINTFFTKFAKLLRTTIEIVNKDKITLNDEINYIKSYVELEQLRTSFPFKFDVVFDDDKLLSNKIPVMILQPLIENAIKHAFNDKLNNNLIKIIIKNDLKDTDYFIIEVEDNGIGINTSFNKNSQHESQAIKSITERIRLLNLINKTNNSIEVNSNTDAIKGTQIILKFKQEKISFL